MRHIGRGVCGDNNMRSLIIALLVGLGACTTMAPGDHRGQAGSNPSGQDCFLASSANGYTIVDDHSVSVDVGANRRYLLATTWNVHDLDWSMGIVLSSRGSDWICTGNGLGVELRGGRPPQTYPITSISRQPDFHPAPRGS
jgi:hypothetical protein